MKIKDRIALYFTLISTSMLFAVLCMVYFTFMKFLQADFFERLTDRTMVTAKLYLEADEISRDALNSIRHKYLLKLNGEIIRVYDEKNRATFIGDSTQYWTTSTINKVRKNGSLKYNDGNRQVVGIFYKDNQGDFVILASAADQGSQNRLSKLLKIMIFTFLLISVLVLMLSRWVAEKMLKPLNLFMLEVKQIGSKNMAFRVRETQNKDEINLIAQSFNHLMVELEQAFILQKTFVANASHELRTPITRMMMNAELTLSKERENTAYKKAIADMLEDAEKMDYIITGLLTLAKVDVELINAQLSPVNLNHLFKDIELEWRDSKMLPFTFINKTTNENLAKISANPVLLQIAIDNIISNAFKFSDNQQVTCELDYIDSILSIQITDKGIGISASKQEEIFKPFFTTSHENGKKGEGMGLYMAQKIINLFKGNLNVTHSEQGNTIFTITLPQV